MVRGAVGMFLLLFFEVRFVGFGCLFLVWEAMRRRDTPPAPLERGILDAAFCLIIGILHTIIFFSILL